MKRTPENVLTFFEDSGHDDYERFYDIKEGFHAEHDGDAINCVGVAIDKPLFYAYSPDFGRREINAISFKNIAVFKLDRVY